MAIVIEHKPYFTRLGMCVERKFTVEADKRMHEHVTLSCPPRRGKDPAPAREVE